MTMKRVRSLIPDMRRSSGAKIAHGKVSNPYLAILSSTRSISSGTLRE